MQADMDACEAVIRHLQSCADCKDDYRCPTGQELNAAFQLVEAKYQKRRQGND
jgi:hypothetical protein